MSGNRPRGGDYEDQQPLQHGGGNQSRGQGPRRGDGLARRGGPGGSRGGGGGRSFQSRPIKPDMQSVSSGTAAFSGSIDTWNNPAPETAAAAAPAPAAAAEDTTPFVVGDIVKLGGSCAKNVQGAEGQIVKASAKNMSVKILTGALQGKLRSVRPDFVAMVHLSSLRQGRAQGRVPTSPSSSAASTSLIAPDTAAAALVQEAELTPEEEEQQEADRAEIAAAELAAQLFEEDSQEE